MTALVLGLAGLAGIWLGAGPTGTGGPPMDQIDRDSRNRLERVLRDADGAQPDARP